MKICYSLLLVFSEIALAEPGAQKDASGSVQNDFDRGTTEFSGPNASGTFNDDLVTDRTVTDWRNAPTAPTVVLPESDSAGTSSGNKQAARREDRAK